MAAVVDTGLKTIQPSVDFKGLMSPKLFDDAAVKQRKLHRKTKQVQGIVRLKHALMIQIIFAIIFCDLC